MHGNNDVVRSEDLKQLREHLGADLDATVKVEETLVLVNRGLAQQGGEG